MLSIRPCSAGFSPVKILAQAQIESGGKVDSIVISETFSYKSLKFGSLSFHLSISKGSSPSIPMITTFDIFIYPVTVQNQNANFL